MFCSREKKMESQPLDEVSGNAPKHAGSTATLTLSSSITFLPPPSHESTSKMLEIKPRLRMPSSVLVTPSWTMLPKLPKLPIMPRTPSLDVPRHMNSQLGPERSAHEPSGQSMASCGQAVPPMGLLLEVGTEIGIRYPALL